MQGSLLTEFENPTSLKNDSEYKKKKREFSLLLLHWAKFAERLKLLVWERENKKGEAWRKSALL